MKFGTWLDAKGQTNYASTPKRTPSSLSDQVNGELRQAGSNLLLDSLELINIPRSPDKPSMEALGFCTRSPDSKVGSQGDIIRVQRKILHERLQQVVRAGAHNQAGMILDNCLVRVLGGVVFKGHKGRFTPCQPGSRSHGGSRRSKSCCKYG